VKVFTIILSIYFLALNFVPCGDTITNNGDINTELSQTLDSSHSHTTGDMCSPFCHCHCCHVHTIAFDVLEFEPINPLTPKPCIKYFDVRKKGYHNSILQPPRV
jgi:hypothetical protein